LFIRAIFLEEIDYGQCDDRGRVHFYTF